MLKQFIFIRNSMPMLMSLLCSGVHDIIKLVVIIAGFHCMLFLTAATHSLITELT